VVTGATFHDPDNLAQENLMAATRRQLSIQYLGVPGSTHECVEAMATILTSPYPCREITILICRKHPQADHYAVSFVIWDWLGTEVTIVPNGFGTHAGTGGWGLEVVLDLIQFYQVPLKEKWIRDVDQFTRINSGYPTERDLKELHQADHGAPSWPLFAREFGSWLWRQAMSEEGRPFPYWLLEPELLEVVRGVEVDPDGAAFRAVKRLEVMVRELGSLDAHLFGDNLINQAMRDSGALVPHGATPAESQAWANLFRGAIGAFKNPQSHRDVKLAGSDAAAQILAVNLLIRKLKADFPEKFAKSDEAESDGEDSDDEDLDERDELEEVEKPADAEDNEW